MALSGPSKGLAVATVTYINYPSRKKPKFRRAPGCGLRFCPPREASPRGPYERCMMLTEFAMDRPCPHELFMGFRNPGVSIYHPLRSYIHSVNLQTIGGTRHWKGNPEQLWTKAQRRRDAKRRAICMIYSRLTAYALWKVM